MLIVFAMSLNMVVLPVPGLPTIKVLYIVFCAGFSMCGNMHFEAP